MERKFKKKQRIIRAWSAGCSSGEESYSLAMLFHEQAQKTNFPFLIKVHGTDIDKNSLDKCKLGSYPKQSIKNMRPYFIKRHFTFEDNSYVLSDKIRLITQFHKQNMVTDKPLTHVDLILCRNVFIYFSKSLQTTIIEKFHQSLHKGGYLILGKCESLFGIITKYFDVVDGNCRIYRKKI